MNFKSINGFLIFYFICFIFAASMWWYLMPKGFPVHHSRFWVNGLFPPVVVLFSFVGIFSVVRQKYIVIKCIILIYSSTILMAGIAGKFLYPYSLSGKLLVLVFFVMLYALVVCVSLFWLWKKKSVGIWLSGLSIVLGLSLGSFLAWSQRAMDAATIPHSKNKKVVANHYLNNVKDILILSEEVSVFPSNGRVSLNSDRVSLDIFPQLTFVSRSPDRFWTIFSPVSMRVNPKRNLIGSLQKEKGILLSYLDDGASNLFVSRISAKNTVKIEAQSYLSQEVYSHLNSFCRLTISGTESLSLSFSPCPKVIELKQSDYPFGRPMRMAYVDKGNTFYVVEATSGEKGPFKTLAKGTLKKGEPLVMTLYHNNKPHYKIIFYDWAKQSSRQLSPCAGWGLPENAIEFSLTRSGNKNQGHIYMTLAGTSVGRGWDSVGHTSGAYRNRILIESLKIK